MVGVQDKHYKPARACRWPYCPNITRDPSGYCDNHADKRAIPRKPDNRPSSPMRGYGTEWRRIRIEVLRASGIPESDWPQYDIDHVPRYDKAREPDHRKYNLIPRLRAVHSRKTIREDGGFGRERTQYRGGIESLGQKNIDRSGYPISHSTESQGKGVGRA